MVFSTAAQQAFAEATQNFYRSDTLQSKVAERQEFLGMLPNYLDGRPVNAENIVRTFLFTYNLLDANCK